MGDSTNEERLNGKNGLLLTPSIDHLFDRGFISFEDTGRLIISPVAHKPSLRKMGIEQPVSVGFHERTEGISGLSPQCRVPPVDTRWLIRRSQTARCRMVSRLSARAASEMSSRLEESGGRVGMPHCKRLSQPCRDRPQRLMGSLFATDRPYHT